MTDSYQYEDDGFVHTRFSELNRCTPGMVDDVIKERINPELKVSNQAKEHGIKRHNDWHIESMETRKLPQCFHKIWQEKLPNLSMEITDVEKQVSNLWYPKVIVHSTIDKYLVGQDITDYKTSITGRVKRTRQNIFYAMQLEKQGIEIPYSIYLFEFWNPDRTEVKDYQHLIHRITDEEKENTNEWLQYRIQVLLGGMRTYNILP